ncbi:hypothetical protein LOY38_05870 [Pseudomonas sp. B21-015]|uniref:hypothetical protein n=1 Tax=Pseudomonas sp. B21-015 TaxID=2895473 RepID=UPI00215E6486|nr:hypothetical protein [Pseudomonas sp. B21-015]UVM51571.1 hypothetical protein LOY38_05870 [Pseudomonas sp. B21-015]
MKAENIDTTEVKKTDQPYKEKCDLYTLFEENIKTKNIAYDELKKLKPRLRNQVRAIISTQDMKAVKLLNILRQKSQSIEIYQIDKTLRAHGRILPELFPKVAQTKEYFFRLDALPLKNQYDLVQRLAAENFQEILSLIEKLGEAGELIISMRLSEAAEILADLTEQHGFSHTLLRKICLIRSLSDETNIAHADSILNKAGAGTRNLILSSILNCYQEEQEILSLKRSIMNLPDRGILNKFTRDITRLTFHPLAKNEDDLSELITSSLQSSLLDAIIATKTNKHFLQIKPNSALERLFSALEQNNPGIDKIAALYPASEEYLFYKHSSAWLENDDIIQYRVLIDHFHDNPESNYFELNDSLTRRASHWVQDISLIDLATTEILTQHEHSNLRRFEKESYITRSAIFNLLIHKADGVVPMTDDALIKIMSNTTDLDRTINVSSIKNLAKLSPSDTSKIILYALIAKRSKNEADNYKLRSLLQKRIISEYKGNIVDFLKELSQESDSVARFLYEICTEDFIARLSHLIKASNQITETRASLHKWWGEFTGEKSYLDRARTLLIDHQINRVRNELDDNRIYVHTARFTEWMSDEVIRELTTTLTSMDHNNTLQDANTPQLLSIIDQCYKAFCSNPIFGISSYLGRRIRHGTFKGHLFSSVVAIKTNAKYKHLINDPTIQTLWCQWVSTYESTIDNIIVNKLHVESQNKRDALLKPHLNDLTKFEIAVLCAKAIAKDFSEHKVTNNSSQIIVEYCWRIVEVDLKSVNSFLKSQKQILIQNDLLNSIKLNTPGRLQETFRDFNRDLMRQIDEKLIAMYGWFKRPVSVSPKASLSLLYKAVIEEVRETFTEFHADTHFEEKNDIELMGGPYHILYDAFYVVVYNAAKHGKPGGKVERNFGITKWSSTRPGKAEVIISSIIKDEEDESTVAERLRVKPGDDIDNAHLDEVRSGIRKLYQLERTDTNFHIEDISCKDRKVVIRISYDLEHL